MSGKVLGLDLGEKTLGIALSDSLGIIASPIETFTFPPYELDKALERVKYYVDRENVHEIALGLPLHMSGKESDHSTMCREFKKQIETNIKEVKVYLIDERWTTKQANRMLINEADLSRKKRKKVVDKIAAQIILDTYLMGRK